MEAHLWILDFDKDFSTPELVAIGAGCSGMDCRIHTDASRSFSSMRARCGSPWFCYGNRNKISLKERLNIYEYRNFVNKILCYNSKNFKRSKK